jgi:hypothetical protein
MKKFYYPPFLLTYKYQIRSDAEPWMINAFLLSR